MYDPLTYRVDATPEATALVDAGADERWTVADLDDAVERTAGRLAALGVGPGDRVGLLLPTRAAAVLVVHAALRLGTPLVPLDPRGTATDVAHGIETAAVAALVCGSSTESAAVAAGERAGLDAGAVGSVDDPATDRATDLGGLVPDAVTPWDWDLGDTLLVAFTSGTTGTPKGVRLTARNVLASAVASAVRLGLDPEETWHVALPLHHVGGLTPVLRTPLYGMTAVIRTAFDADAVAADLREYDVTATSLVPTTLSRLLDATEGTVAPTLRAVLLGGAPASADLLDRCRERDVPVYPTYGMTEAASQIATATPAETAADPGTVGRPLLGTRLAVLDGAGDELPPGEVGEFVVRGPTVTPGYLDPEATAEAFGPHGLHTGDVGYRDADGRVWVLGRIDDRIVTGGENVAPAEVADALRTHPDVADAAVVGVPDEAWGERVAALVVPTEGTPPSTDALEAHCREHLADYKRPRTIRITDTLPRTDSGTVDREAVRERLR
jgi:O-succinylbenzoic acid--CoA ligase